MNRSGNRAAIVDQSNGVGSGEITEKVLAKQSPICSAYSPVAMRVTPTVMRVEMGTDEELEELKRCGKTGLRDTREGSSQSEIEPKHNT